jgi:hypothetical protein
MKKDNNKDYTEVWKKLQRGIDYNTKLDLYTKNTLYWNFYNDNQWIGVKNNGLPKWQFNICKAIINYFVAFICSQTLKIKYSINNVSDNAVTEEDKRLELFAEKMSNIAQMKWEKDKMDYKLRKLMTDGAVTGDYCAYVLWDKNIKTGQYETGDFTTEVVDGVNVFFGNPNCADVEKQPYILIRGRDTVDNLQNEARTIGKISEEEIQTITSDTDTEYQAGEQSKKELENAGEFGKCTFVIEFYKKNGTVYFNKSTKNCVIRKDVDLGIEKFPVAWGNWDTIKNSYHGNPPIAGIIDNQISINQLFAMVAYAMKMNAFGKVVYDGTRIIDGWNNNIGEAIRADGDVDGIVKQIQAGNFNSAILSVIDMAVNYTKQFVGANDILMGTADARYSSGVAVVAIQKQAAIPLSNIIANKIQFLEDLALIWGEFTIKKYKSRVINYEKNGTVIKDEFNTEGMEDVLLNTKIDISESSYLSEITAIQTLDALLQQGVINKVQYFDRLKNMGVIPNCEGLLEDSKAELQQQQQLMQQQQEQEVEQLNAEQEQAVAQEEQYTQEAMAQEEAQQAEKNINYEKMAQFMDALPQETKDKLAQLPPDELEATVLKMMKQQVFSTQQSV